MTEKIELGGCGGRDFYPADESPETFIWVPRYDSENRTTQYEQVSPQPGETIEISGQPEIAA